MWKTFTLCDIQCFCDGTHQYSVLAPFSPCCEKQLKTFGLSANSRRVYWDLFAAKTHTGDVHICAEKGR